MPNFRDHALAYARDLVPRLNLAQRRHGLDALGAGVAAARREAAAGRRIKQTWHDAGDRLEARLLGRRRVDARDRTDQPLGIRMAWIGKEFADRRLLDHLA